MELLAFKCSGEFNRLTCTSQCKKTIFKQFCDFIVLFRFPKNQEIAKQWNIALGIDTNEIVYGLICFEHFEDRHFKRRNKTELKPDAVPTIFLHRLDPSGVSTINFDDNNNDEIYQTQRKITPASSMASNASVAATVDAASCNVHLTLQCTACDMRDRLINEKESQIRELRKKLLKAQQKNWYLEKTKKN